MTNEQKSLLADKLIQDFISGISEVEIDDRLLSIESSLAILTQAKKFDTRLVSTMKQHTLRSVIRDALGVKGEEM